MIPQVRRSAPGHGPGWSVQGGFVLGENRTGGPQQGLSCGGRCPQRSKGANRSAPPVRSRCVRQDGASFRSRCWGRRRACLSAGCRTRGRRAWLPWNEPGPRRGHRTYRSCIHRSAYVNLLHLPDRLDPSTPRTSVHVHQARHSPPRASRKSPVVGAQDAPDTELPSRR